MPLGHATITSVNRGSLTVSIFFLLIHSQISTELMSTTGLDGAFRPHGPEDLRDVISAYQKRVSETVRRFDGFVAKYLGDGVLAFFGSPQAHEDAAELAVQASLELTRAREQGYATVKTKYVVIWERVDGKSKLDSDIWNLNK